MGAAVLTVGAAGTGARDARWRAATVAALFLGYAGFYVCRSNLSVAAPLLAADAGVAGLSTAAIGAIASMGVLAYALGKPLTGVAGDLAGGRRMFVGAMWGTVVATLMFSAGSSVTALAAAWVANRFVQSAGWGAMTKLVAQWFPAERHGRIMAVLSLSYLFGDAAGRVALGALIDAGAGWRWVFVASAAMLGAAAVGVGATLAERPSAVGLDDPPRPPRMVYAGDARPTTGTALLGPLIANPMFWLVCALSCGLTFAREAFNIWIPTFLRATYGMTGGEAARWSALFPLMGGISVVAVGVMGDRLGPGRRMALAAPLVLVAGLSTALASAPAVMADARLGLLVLGLIALLLLGPYSLLAGALALEIGGPWGAATAAGLIDSAGYLGALASGLLVGFTAETAGWAWAWRLLGVVIVGSSAIGVAIARAERREHAVPDLARRDAHDRKT